jgi:alpha-glucosidase
VRSVMDLRHSLLPYLYTQMWRAAAEDVPPVRPLLWDFAADATAGGIEDAFMLGPDLLVAPVLEEGAVTRAVYLPAHPGGWYDWHDGAHFEGGRTVTVAAPLGRLPLFARAGAIIPVEDENGLTAIAFGTPDHAASSLLYLDDGETADWRKVGKAIELRLRRDGGGFVLDVDGELPTPIRVRSVGVTNVRVGGAVK